jgi:hypothetical protein
VDASVRLLITEARHGQKKAKLIDTDGAAWTFIHVPPKIEHLDKQLDFVIVPRPANHPLVERRGSGLARLRLTWLLGFRDRRLSIEDRLSGLQGLCRSGKYIRFDYGPNESGWWVCVDLSWETLARNLGGDATRAQVQLELARAVDPRVGALVTLVRPATARAAA